MSGATKSPYDAWLSRPVDETDRLDVFPARGMSALLDRSPETLLEGAALPRGWHWLYFKPTTPRGGLGPDGHAARGGFLPPIDLSRRMWAGGRLRFRSALTMGESATRRSEVRSIATKEGRTGRLGFVSVAHTVFGAGGVAVEEEQELVYREMPRPGRAAGPVEPPKSADWEESFLPDSVVLFRFSALTFNGHRIHYDQPYATQVEGYPGLVVHAPLTALLLLDAAERWGGGEPASYRYRAVAPAFGDQPMTLAGRVMANGLELWAAGPDGGLVMQASVEWASS